MANITALVQ